MSLSNISQLLLRNPDYLIAENPLLVNLEPDQFIEQLKSHVTGNITYFSNNFKYVQQINEQYSPAVHCIFDHKYSAQIKHDLVIIQFPKSKAELNYTIHMLNENLAPNAKILVVGENKSGIKSLEKLTKETLEHVMKVDSARHCILYSAQLKPISSTFEIKDWFSIYQVKFKQHTIQVAALPGVFSQQGLDKGTAVLLENLPTSMNGKVLDFGCGAGIIAAAVGLENPDAKLSLLDVSALALASAEKTLSLNKLSGEVFASNSLSKVNKKYDMVISNPPFHQGLKTHYHATESFLSEIKQHLNSKFKVTVVANSFLKYQPIMEKHIGATKRITQSKGFTIYQSTSTN